MAVLIVSIAAAILGATVVLLRAGAVSGSFDGAAGGAPPIVRLRGPGPIRLPRGLGRPTHRVATVPCLLHPGCFRWTILSADGVCLERSGFSYATAAGARSVGALRLREAYPRR